MPGVAVGWVVARFNQRQLRMLELLQQPDHADGSVALGLDILRGGGARTLDALISTGLVEFVRIEKLTNRYRLTPAGKRAVVRDIQRNGR